MSSFAAEARWRARMLGNSPFPTIRLPAGWPRHVRSAMLHVISLARLACLSARGWAATHANAGVRRQAEQERCPEELALLREEVRI